MSAAQHTPSRAEPAYQAGRQAVALLLDKLGDRLAVHAERQERDPENWGHVGDLGHVIQQLNKILAFLG